MCLICVVVLVGSHVNDRNNVLFCYCLIFFLCNSIVGQHLLCMSVDMQPICDVSIESLICLVSHLLLIYHTGVSYTGLSMLTVITWMLVAAVIIDM
jgi:hypothetical protein